jgi:hypothetical protein
VLSRWKVSLSRRSEEQRLTLSRAGYSDEPDRLPTIEKDEKELDEKEPARP